MHSTYHHRVPLHMDVRLACVDDLLTCADDKQLAFEFESIIFVIGTQELRDASMGYPLIVPGTYAGAALATHGRAIAGIDDVCLLSMLFDSGVQVTARIFVKSQHDKVELRKGTLGHTLLRTPIKGGY